MSKKQIKITVENRRAKLEGDFPITRIRRVTSYPIKGIHFRPSYRKRKGWDGRNHLLVRPTNTFPSGLVSIVKDELLKWAEEKSIDLEIVFVDKRTKPSPKTSKGNNFNLTNGYNLYPYQTPAANAMVSAERGILKAATNAGKTFIFAAVCQYLQLPALLIVPGKELLYQAKDDIEKCLGWAVGLIGDGKWQPEFVTIATYHTLSRWLSGKNKEKKKKVKEFLSGIDLFCVDECHTASAKSTYKILSACPAYYRYGMSGTPLERTDGADLRLIAQTGPVLYEITNKQLVDSGYSIGAEVLFVKVSEPVIPENCDYHTVYREGIALNVFRNACILEQVLNYTVRGLQCVVMVQRLEHGDELAKLLDNTELEFEYISGEEDTPVRQSAIQKFKDGQLSVLLTTNILKQGISIDKIDVIINGAGGKSTIETIQRLGRGLRTGGNSDTLYMVDFADTTHSYLAKHSIKRLRDYKNEGCFAIKWA